MAPVIVQNHVNLNLPNNCEETGFPFDDSDYDSNERLQTTLEDIAQRHPEFADHLTFDRFPSWRRKRFGSSLSNERDEPRESPRTQPGQSSRSFDTPDRRFGEHSFPSGFNRFPFTSHFDDFGEDISTEKPPESPRKPENRGRKVNPNLPQHLSNTVDLGQKQTPVEESRGQRSMSAPPENRTCRNSSERDMGSYMTRPNQAQPNRTQQNPRERIIPIHVEGRDEPVLPKNINIEIQRPTPNEFNTNIQHQAAPKQQAPPPQQASPTSQQHEEAPPPTAPQMNKNDPLEKIKSVKSDVLDLMQQVENFALTRKDKLYAYLDEMLTINLLKLDDVETDGKDNIRIARKEAIKCIQECISKLEAKALSNEQKQKNDSTNVVKPEEVKVENQEKEATESKKPVFKSTASIELQPPLESEMELQVENTSEAISLDNKLESTSQEQMDIDKISKVEGKSAGSSKTEVEKQTDSEAPLSDLTNSSQKANETSM